MTFEATAVTPEGRITLWDSGLWSDAHVAVRSGAGNSALSASVTTKCSSLQPLQRIVDFVHANGALASMQVRTRDGNPECSRGMQC